MLKNGSFRSAIKCEITPETPKLILKKITFFSPILKMRGKKMNFEDKEIKKTISTKTKKYSREMKLELI